MINHFLTSLERAIQQQFIAKFEWLMNVNDKWCPNRLPTRSLFCVCFVCIFGPVKKSLQEAKKEYGMCAICYCETRGWMSQSAFPFSQMSPALRSCQAIRRSVRGHWMTSDWMDPNGCTGVFRHFEMLYDMMYVYMTYIYIYTDIYIYIQIFQHKMQKLNKIESQLGLLGFASLQHPK